MTGQFVIIGGGIAGLTAAALVKRHYHSSEVIVVEQVDTLGGLHRCFDYGEFGLFDCGMHFITSTGVEEIDKLFFELLPPDQWEMLEGNKRDRSGLYFRGRLQENSQFIDLRYLEPEAYRECVADFFCNLKEENSKEPESMSEFARRRFGPVIAKTYIDPIVRKIHGNNAADIDVMARSLPLLDRIILFDEDIFLDLMKSPLLCSRLAYPEQRSLPLQYSSGKFSIYPTQYGIGRVVNMLVKKLKSDGVKFLTGSCTTSVCMAGNRITAVHLSGGEIIEEPNQVIWTAGLPPLARLLNIDTSDLTFDSPQTTVICSLLLDQPPATGDLYCLFCADENYYTYRVTNFSAYCTGAPRANGYPICVELLMPPNTPELIETCRTLAVEELRKSQLITDDTKVLFSAAEALRGGFPSVTRNNISNIDTIRSRVQMRTLSNLENCGILAKPGLFFQHDVLVDVYGKITGHSAIPQFAHCYNTSRP